jgi:Ca2+-binding RTX toxin-like protein
MMQPGTHTVSIGATDQAGNTASVSQSYTVFGAGLVAGDLVVVGSEVCDEIEIRETKRGLKVLIDGVSHGLFAAEVGKVIAYGLGGDDTIRAGSVRKPVRFIGGDGDDRLIGGRSHDLLLGGLGNDRLRGGEGDDLLIGGLGSDHIRGNGAILINGTTAYDDDLAALELILQTWSDPSLSYAARVSRIESGLGSDSIRLSTKDGNSTVFDDAIADTLVGKKGQNWFFAELGVDKTVPKQKPAKPAKPK